MSKLGLTVLVLLSALVGIFGIRRLTSPASRDSTHLDSPHGSMPTTQPPAIRPGSKGTTGNHELAVSNILETLSRLGPQLLDSDKHFQLHDEIEDQLVEVSMIMADPSTCTAMTSEILDALKSPRTRIELHVLIALLARSPWVPRRVVTELASSEQPLEMCEAAAVALLLKPADPLQGDALEWKAHESGPWCALTYLISFPILAETSSPPRGDFVKWGELLYRILETPRKVTNIEREILQSSTNWSLAAFFAERIASIDPPFATTLARNVWNGAKAQAALREDAVFALQVAMDKHEDSQVERPDGTIIVQTVPNDAQELLLHILHNDSSANVKVAALDILLRKGKGFVAEELLRKTADSARGLEEVERSVVAWAGKLDSANSIALLIDYYQMTASPAVRTVCVVSLQSKSQSETRTKREFISRALQDDSPLVRKAALAKVIGLFGGEGKQSLETVAARDLDPDVRRLAHELMR